MSYTQGQNVGVTWGSALGGIQYQGSAKVVTSTGDSVTREATLTEVKSRQGDVFGAVITGHKEKLSLTVYPSGDADQGDFTTIIPNIGETVVVTSDDTDVDGKWINVNCSKAYKNEGILEFSIELFRSQKMKTDDTMNAPL